MANPASDALVTRRRDRALVIALWNLVDPGKPGSAKMLQLEFRGVNSNSFVELSRLDVRHGDSLGAYQAMGKPRYPTAAQINQLNRAAVLPVSERRSLRDGRITLTIPSDGLVILEMSR